MRRATRQPGETTGDVRTRAVKALTYAVLVIGMVSATGHLVVAAAGTVGGTSGAVRVTVDRDLLVLDPELVASVQQGRDVTLTAPADPTALRGWPDQDHRELRLDVERLPLGLRAATHASTFLVGLLLAFGTLVLYRTLSEVAAGRPFGRRTPAGIEFLAGLVLMGALLPQLLDAVASASVLWHLGGLQDGRSPLGYPILDLPLWHLGVVAVLAVLGQVFRHGQRLTEDVEGLV